MEWNQRVESLVKWGEQIKAKDWQPHYPKIEQFNPWFTEENVRLALSGLLRYLDHNNLTRFVEKYQNHQQASKTIGIIMAGNIPLVGVQDLICCYLAGHRVLIKPSSQDTLLLNLLLGQWFTADPKADQSMNLVSDLKATDIDALIATGSDNTNRYFKFNFQLLPGILRSNRTSIAVVRGNENFHQLQALGHDIYSYFGRGCRNVSKIMVPNGYDIRQLIEPHDAFRSLLNNKKYLNNYRYQKAIHLAQNLEHLDTGYSLLVQNETIGSPLSVLYFEFYHNQKHLKQLLDLHSEKTQCVASADGWYQNSYSFGSLQSPDLWDYADGIDTMAFLMKLS